MVREKKTHKNIKQLVLLVLFMTQDNWEQKMNRKSYYMVYNLWKVKHFKYYFGQRTKTKTF